MKTQHTPGPWQIEAGLTGICICAPVTASSAPTRPIIAETCNQAISLEEEEFNARLIASAPQLLEALEALLFDYNTKLDAYNDYRIAADGMPPVKEDDSAIAARTAIAKAKGGTL